jgi:hypothetical protein
LWNAYPIEHAKFLNGMKTFLLIVGIIILIPLAIRATRNLRNALKNEKDIYLNSHKPKK